MGQGGRRLGSTTRRGGAKPKTKMKTWSNPVGAQGGGKPSTGNFKTPTKTTSTKSTQNKINPAEARKQAFEKAATILDGAGKAASALSDKGLSLNQSASSVRSGASTGAKTTDPWRSFTTESGSVNDNN